MSKNIIKRLKIVCKESNIEITDEALNTIAILSEGAMRDALSILERCVQDGVNNIDDDYIKELVGIPKLSYIKQIVEGVLTYNIEQVLESTNLVLEEGKDITVEPEKVKDIELQGEINTNNEEISTSISKQFNIEINNSYILFIR